MGVLTVQVQPRILTCAGFCNTCPINNQHVRFSLRGKYYVSCSIGNDIKQCYDRVFDNFLPVFFVLEVTSIRKKIACEFLFFLHQSRLINYKTGKTGSQLQATWSYYIHIITKSHIYIPKQDTITPLSFSNKKTTPNRPSTP